MLQHRKQQNLTPEHHGDVIALGMSGVRYGAARHQGGIGSGCAWRAFLTTAAEQKATQRACSVNNEQYTVGNRAVSEKKFWTPMSGCLRRRIVGHIYRSHNFNGIAFDRYN